MLWGIDASVAVRANRIAVWREVENIEIAVDKRSMDSFVSVDGVLSEPYVLQGIEIGLDHETSILSARVYEAQVARYEATGVPTMVSEDHVDQDPFFVYSAVFANGKAWNVVSEKGEEFPELRSLSTKVAFAWDALFQTEYTELVRNVVENHDLASDEGWFAGIYETGNTVNEAMTLNTNAVILEAISFKAFGPLLRMQGVEQNPFMEPLTGQGRLR